MFSREQSVFKDRTDAGIKLAKQLQTYRCNDTCVFAIPRGGVPGHGCYSSGQCELQKIMAHFHIDRRRIKRLRLPKAEQPLEHLNTFLDYDPDKCVCCGICVQTCQEILGASFLYFVERGYGTKIAFFGDESQCECCLECAARCPVEVLIAKWLTSIICGYNIVR